MSRRWRSTTRRGKNISLLPQFELRITVNGRDEVADLYKAGIAAPR